MAANNIELTLVGRFVDNISAKAKAAFGSVAKLSRGVGGAINGAAAAFSTFGGKAESALGKAASGLGNIVGALATLGPMGAVITGISVAFEVFSKKMTAASDAALTFATSLRSAMAKKLADVRAKEIDGLNRQLDAAIARADKASRAFEDVAESFLKVAKAKDATAAATDDLAEAELRAERQKAVNAAASPDAAATAAAGYDVKIAAQKLDRTKKDTAVDVADAEQAYRFAVERLTIAKQKERDLTDALAKAEAESAERSGIDAQFDRALRDRRDKAAKAQEAATALRNKAEIAAKVAAEAVKTARLKQAKAVTEAAAGLAGAEDAQKKLAKEQARAARERLAADKVACLESLRAAKAAAENAAAQARTAEAVAMGRYKDPKAANAADKAAKRTARDVKTFDRRAERLMKRDDWRTADNLMSADKRIRDVLLARERAEAEDQKAKSLEANMDAAAKDLAAIRQSIEGAITL